MTKSNYETTFTSLDIERSESGIPYISWTTLSDKMGSEYKAFIDWMTGQTSLQEGAYISDIRNYYYKRDRGELNSLPHGY